MEKTERGDVFKHRDLKQTFAPSLSPFSLPFKRLKDRYRRQSQVHTGAQIKPVFEGSVYDNSQCASSRDYEMNAKPPQLRKSKGQRGEREERKLREREREREMHLHLSGDPRTDGQIQIQHHRHQRQRADATSVCLHARVLLSACVNVHVDEGYVVYVFIIHMQSALHRARVERKCPITVMRSDCDHTPRHQNERNRERNKTAHMPNTPIHIITVPCSSHAYANVM
ncbi:uncharacterized protein V6R79_004440 [Siganus canaliculatus]